MSVTDVSSDPPFASLDRAGSGQQILVKTWEPSSATQPASLPAGPPLPNHHSSGLCFVVS